ncbi:hypothetical protein AYO44_01430 [Planctomycetaceae bacterium SCGC AG-212-F19]|nr:hypothetical protein AYO44_01430 [Planctomycetaceae bacterium SCGC AG-212-F19]
MLADGKSSGRGRPLVAFAALHALHIDAVEKHGEVSGAYVDARGSAGRGEVENAFFEPLVLDGEAAGFPVAQLEAIAGQPGAIGDAVSGRRCRDGSARPRAGPARPIAPAGLRH